MAIIFSKIEDLETIADEKYKIKKQTEDKELEIYKNSDAYKQFLQDVQERNKKEQDDFKKKEAERLAYFIKMHGEVEGPKYMRL